MIDENTDDTNDAYKRTTAASACDEDGRKCNGGGGNVSLARRGSVEGRRGGGERRIRRR